VLADKALSIIHAKPGPGLSYSTAVCTSVFESTITSHVEVYGFKSNEDITGSQISQLLIEASSFFFRRASLDNRIPISYKKMIGTATKV